MTHFFRKNTNFIAIFFAFSLQYDKYVAKSDIRATKGNNEIWIR